MSYGREASRTRIHPNDSIAMSNNPRRHHQRSDSPEPSSSSPLADHSLQVYAITQDIRSVAKSIRLQQIVLDLIIIIATFLTFIFINVFLDPKLAYVTCDQSDVFYPKLDDTIPFWAVGVYATIAPIIIILAIELLQRILPGGRKSVLATFLDIYQYLSLYAQGIAITLLLTEIGKRWVGRLRPHFIAVCQPILSTLDCSTSSTTSGFTYKSIYTGGSFCQNSDSSSVEEARLSFPSGHSSYSTFCMLYLIIYIEARFVSFRLRYFKLLLQTAAFITTYVTCVSRVSDYHHRGSDVIGGIVVGAIVSLFVTIVVARHLFLCQKSDDKKN